MSSEASLWQRVRAGLSAYGHLQRIETGVTGDAGVPDINYCFGGREGWLELKHGIAPARASTSVFKSQRGLDPSQIEWLMYRWKCGGRAFILTQLGSELLLHHAAEATRFNSYNLSQLRATTLFYHTGPMNIPGWRRVAEGLIA